MTVIGLRYCFQHMPRDLHLRILPSAIPRAGKGVFAAGQPHQVVFRRGDLVCYYDGIPQSTGRMDQLYGPDDEIFAPYAIKSEAVSAVEHSHRYPHHAYRVQAFGDNEDAAWHRGIGSMVNHARRNRANVHFRLVRMPWDIYRDYVHSFGQMPLNRRYTIGLIADRDITGGEELLTFYGGGYNPTDETYHRHKPDN
jgi:hypothetical protein